MHRIPDSLDFISYKYFIRYLPVDILFLDCLLFLLFSAHTTTFFQYLVLQLHVGRYSYIYLPSMFLSRR